MPKVSVIILTCNRADYICGAIDSVLSQTCKDYEVIVVDDGSTDHTRELLKKYGSLIKYVFQEKKGIVSTRNEALKISKGELVAFLDDDDAWEAENLRKKVLFLDQHPEVAAVTSDFAFFGDFSIASSFAQRQLFQEKKSGDAFVITDTFGLLIEQCFMFSSTVILRKEIIQKFGGFQIENAEDYDLFMRISQKLDFGCINEVLLKKRAHKDATTGNYARDFSSRILFLNNIQSSYGMDYKYVKKIRKRVGDTNTAWAHRLIKDGRLKEGREKAVLSLSHGFNYSAFKMVLLSFAFIQWLRRMVKHA